jgi:hypothetical protein
VGEGVRSCRRTHSTSSGRAPHAGSVFLRCRGKMCAVEFFQACMRLLYHHVSQFTRAQEQEPTQIAYACRSSRQAGRHDSDRSRASNLQQVKRNEQTLAHHARLRLWARAPACSRAASHPRHSGETIQPACGGMWQDVLYGWFRAYEFSNHHVAFCSADIFSSATVTVGGACSGKYTQLQPGSRDHPSPR